MNEETRTCKCGAALRPAARFCRACGSPAPLKDEPDGAGTIEWELSYPLLTNRFFLYDMAKLLFWTFAIFDGVMLVVLSFQSGIDSLLPFLRISGFILLGFVLAITAITLVVFGNR